MKLMTFDDPHESEFVHTRVLSQASALLNAYNVPIEETLRLIIDTCIKLLGAERGFIMLCKEGDVFELKIGRTSSGFDLTLTDFQFSRSIAQQVIKQGKAVLISDVSLNESLADKDSVCELGLGSAIAVPMRFVSHEDYMDSPERRRIPLPVFNEMIGVMYLDSTSTREEYTNADVGLFQGMANMATASLVYSSLYNQATRDELTGTFIRRYFDQALRDELEQVISSNLPLSLIMLDIDYFKKVNDTYGHPTGDMVLKETGQLLLDSIRKIDICARFGGEEFVIILPGTDAQGAYHVAEKIRIQFENNRFSDQALKITLSAGIAEATTDMAEPRKLVYRADQALYRAKENGRNRTITWMEDFSSLTAKQDTLSGIISGEPDRDSNYVRSLLKCNYIALTTLHYEKLLTTVLEQMLNTTSAELAVLFEQLDRGNLEARLIRHNKADTYNPAGWFDMEMVRNVIKNNQTVYDNTTCSAEKNSDTVKSERSPLSTICIPLNIPNSFQGAFYLATRAEQKNFSVADINYLKILTRQTANHLEQADLLSELYLFS